MSGATHLRLISRFVSGKIQILGKDAYEDVAKLMMGTKYIHMYCTASYRSELFTSGIQNFVQTAGCSLKRVPDFS